MPHSDETPVSTPSVSTPSASHTPASHTSASHSAASDAPPLETDVATSAGASPAAPSAWSGAGKRVKTPPGLPAVLILLVLWLLITGSGFLPESVFAALDIGPLRSPPFPMIAAGLLLLASIGLFGWNNVALGPAVPGTAALFWLPHLYLVMLAVAIFSLGLPPAPEFLALVFVMFWLALSEELMFRGLLFPALRGRFRIWPSILLTCVIFGLIHLPNAFGQSTLINAAIQSVAAMMTGLVLLAIRLRRGSIWPAIWYHMAWNVGVFGLGLSARDASPSDITTPTQFVADGGLRGSLIILALMIPNAGYALYLLRRAHHGGLPGDVNASEVNTSDVNPVT